MQFFWECKSINLASFLLMWRQQAQSRLGTKRRRCICKCTLKVYSWLLPTAVPHQDLNEKLSGLYWKTVKPTSYKDDRLDSSDKSVSWPKRMESHKAIQDTLWHSLTFSAQTVSLEVCSGPLKRLLSYFHCDAWFWSFRDQGCQNIRLCNNEGRL
jgi:hypothetical protein